MLRIVIGCMWQVTAGETISLSAQMAVPRQYSVRRALNRKSLAPIVIAEASSHLAPMLRLLKLFVWAVRAPARSRQALVLNNLALRHQLATLAHRGPPVTAQSGTRDFGQGLSEILRALRRP